MDARVTDELVENRRRFQSFLERRLGDPEAAAELLQAAYLRGLERAGEIRREESAVAWFYRLLRNALVDHWRARGAERRATELLARELGEAHEPAPEVENELCRCFEAQLGELRPDYAEILRQVDLAGERPSDFAARQGLTANNAMVRLHRARRALRDRLLVLCGTCAEHGCLDCNCHAHGCKAEPPHPSAGVRGEPRAQPDAAFRTTKGKDRKEDSP